MKEKQDHETKIDNGQRLQDNPASDLVVEHINSTQISFDVGCELIN
jgi:hypothetical protein